jgi:3-methylfumaryl-CoA hydratase
VIVPPDDVALHDWIGREEAAEDVLTPSLVERFCATFSIAGPVPCERGTAPGLIHFCLTTPSAIMADIGEDGSPARRTFLPPVPLPRRMWAASALRFHRDLRIGERVRRVSRIADIAMKKGRSGFLCFVSIDHRIEGEAGLAIEDRQTIVYREAAPSGHATTDDGAAAEQGQKVVTIPPSNTLLFRYSAMTFNAHRIHYDLPYATQIEGYGGLVVQGPLQATLLFHLATRERGEAPRSFRFRSVSPLLDTDPISLHATMGTDSMALWTARPGGPLAMQAEAIW